MSAPLSTHILTIDEDTKSSIICTDPDTCKGWWSCEQPHLYPDGSDARGGPEETPDDAPWSGAEEFEFHGQLHTWAWGEAVGPVWSVVAEGCIVADSSWDHPSGIDLEEPGSYYLGVEWDGGHCYLTSLGPVESPAAGAAS